MGAVASIVPDDVSKEELGRLSVKYDGDSIFKQDKVYKSLKDGDKSVDRGRLSSIFKDSCEIEVMRLYLSICDGHMDENKFLKLCRHAKVLSKHTFTRGDASRVFKQCSKSGSINYITFRFKLIPMVLEKKKKEEREFIVKLSRVEPPVKQKKLQKKIRELTRGVSSMSIDDAEEMRLEQAAIRIQKIQRYTQARCESLQRKELRRIESTPPEELLDLVVPAPPDEEETEGAHATACRRLFASYSTSGEMNCYEFVKFCYETLLIPKESVVVDFTSRQARHLFHKTVATYYDSKMDSYREGVLHGKRITYAVFRGVILPEIASVKGKSMKEMEEYLATCQPVERLDDIEEGMGVISLQDHVLNEFSPEMILAHPIPNNSEISNTSGVGEGGNEVLL
mmetsp:Transcript_6241/g.9411  ORF Transcript_6241/g.9411 Transcript_6241/m.9411 type:complete len:396 (-) Transcript_6241:136-1323(-)|eukprot:CAMPEP_0185034786 /NCGR_PEP_ID=MMETSP1103-20130426/24955_1 /TAXON_ID=36769 /ORGANISM="Paraphysomonas bandaiensis, Strain Caron Lab Isolate" /LENGTH=395 /DNA_ID=CAMNT_0027571573 /DNA_START=154 /DNA_END=1341 /DNA_ORIENTATION=+